MSEQSTIVAQINERPVLLAKNSSLNPYIPCSAGWHAWKLLKARVPDATRRDFLRVFDIHKFTKDFNRTAFRNRVVLILGGSPHSFGLAEQLVHPQVIDDVIWRQLPLPGDSWYDDPANEAVASMVFESLYLNWGAPQHVHF